MCKGVRVFTFGECKNAYVEAFRQEHVHTTQGRMQSGSIAVVEECDVFGEPVYEAHLARGQRCAARCHHVLHTGLEHGDDVEVTFYQEHLVIFGNGLLGLEQAVEFVFLVVDVRFGRVDVFSDAFCLLLLFGEQCASSKCYHAA